MSSKLGKIRRETRSYSYYLAKCAVSGTDIQNTATMNHLDIKANSGHYQLMEYHRIRYIYFLCYTG